MTGAPGAAGASAAAAFSRGEMSRRRRALADVARTAEVEHVLLYGANRSGSAVQWLTGWPVTREAVVVHSPGGGERGEPADSLLVQFFNHVPQARQLARDAEVRWAGARPVATAIEELAIRGAGP